MFLLRLIELLISDPRHFLINLVIISVILILPLLISISIHEWAHGMVAYLFGDPTPKNQGRLSINPFAHLDPVGTLMLFIIGIGWAKPVIINPDNIHGKIKLMLVALAGPGSNILLAIIFSFIKFAFLSYTTINGINFDKNIFDVLNAALNFIIQINLILCVFNMLPIPPLDGSNVLRYFLPDKIAESYSRLAPYGMFVLLLLLFTVGFSFIFNAAAVLESYIYKFIEYIMIRII